MVFIKPGLPVSNAVLLQQGGGNGLNVLLLEDAKILSQPAAPEGRSDSQAVAHLPAVVLFHPKTGNDTADIALRGIALPDGQSGIFLQ
ncbi:hypothetical protein SDC9_174724 [bioreactor metagenome]|uniref:Uncharacterized protein n=1 Tax=bioreactor metagenome TaxID=1076179 RepID=A0A645GUH0_9ZZZZ